MHLLMTMFAQGLVLWTDLRKGFIYIYERF